MPEGEIFLSYSDRLMMDFFFFSNCSKVFHWNMKRPKNMNIVTFTLFLSSRVFLLGVVMGIHIVCTLLLTAKYTIGALAKLPNAK